ncbi:MAG: flavin reductase family protein [Desulfobacterales bacterium]|nr:flavin reductase family protein [Desulfobacterales bacterium]
MKKPLDGINVLYPTPTTIVGAIVEGKVNFITIAHIGIVNHARPYLISLSLAKPHHTNAGIKENKTFSVNIPNEDLVVETDYVGIVSGKKTDKSSVFEVFYGNLENAPMITECPINMECKLYDVYDTPTHDLFIGEIVETYADESVLKNGKVDLARLKPLLFDMSSIKYWSIGNPVAGCWNIGKQLKKK